MSELPLNPGDISGSHVKIGAATHTRRNVLMAGAALAAVAGMIGFYRYSAATDAPKLELLASFRAAYSEKCNAADFAGATPKYVANAYLRSPKLQEVVAQQQAALATASCAEVERALKDASFPVSSKSP